MARTSPSHGGNRGSTPRRVTKYSKTKNAPTCVFCFRINTAQAQEAHTRPPHRQPPTGALRAPVGGKYTNISIQITLRYTVNNEKGNTGNPIYTESFVLKISKLIIY